MTSAIVMASEQAAAMPLDEINAAFDLMHKGESIRSVINF